MPEQEKPAGNLFTGLISVAGVAFVSMVAFLYSQVQGLQKQATENTSEIRRVDQREDSNRAQFQAQLDRRLAELHEQNNDQNAKIGAIQTELNLRAQKLAELESDQHAHEEIDRRSRASEDSILDRQIQVRAEIATLIAQKDTIWARIDALQKLVEQPSASLATAVADITGLRQSVEAIGKRIDAISAKLDELPRPPSH